MIDVKRAGWGSLAALAMVVVTACSGATASPTSQPSATAAASTPPASASGSTAGCTPATSANNPQPPSTSITLQGAGATFPAPLYKVWFEQFSGKYANVRIDYQANGSGAGIKAITQQTVDFGASDAAMKDSEIGALPAGTKIEHVPTALGAVVVIYSLPGVDKLQLDSENIADIFLGNITTWNDPKIAANNAGITLPSKAIQVFHRSDASGTTNTFTTYLDTVSPDWHARVGKGKDVKWPTGTGASGNDGVAGGVKQTESSGGGGVGYVELNYATTAKLTSAYVKNADGNFVPGSVDGATTAAETAVANVPADFRAAPIINGKGANTYPIASYTYLLVYMDQKDADKGKALVAFMAWALTDGQALEKDLGYAPLPCAIQVKAVAELHTITTGGSAIWP